MQGTLLFLGLLVLLWVPLIVFSSGNPTYKVGLGADCILDGAGGGGGGQGAMGRGNPLLSLYQS